MGRFIENKLMVGLVFNCGKQITKFKDILMITEYMGFIWAVYGLYMGCNYCTWKVKNELIGKQDAEIFSCQLARLFP